jgi:hypothetical protein
MNKDINVILVKPKKSWLGKLITGFTHGEYSHCAIMFEGEIYEDAITIDRNNEIYNGVYEDDQLIGELWAYTQDLTTYQRYLGREFLQKNLGKKYGLLKLFLMIFIFPTRWFWNKINYVPFEGITKGMICSEFVVKFFNSMDINILPGLNDELSVPSDFIKSPFLQKIN